MKNILLYLLQMILASGVLYGYYHLFLREKKFHQYNRFYLLSATIISILVPFIDIPVYYNKDLNNPSLIYETLYVISTHPTETFNFSSITSTGQSVFFNWQNLIAAIYIFAGVFVLTRFSIALYKIKYLLKVYPVKKIEKIHFIETSEPGTPFSFFKWLFWNNKIHLNSAEGEQIFRHELFHIQQKHSWDIVFMELLTILFWINPFFHLIKKEIKAIHEFLADEFAMKDSQNWKYAELLLMQALGTQNNRLTNPFFHNQIKRRISMITSTKYPRYQYIRKVMVVPIVAILFGLLAFKIQNNENKNVPIKSQVPITVVIDPGHGGKDPGVSWKGIHEKDICLAIAKKIRELNKDENIHLLFTRLDDSATSPKEDAEYADKNNADLLISLHINASDLPNIDLSKKGIEVYVSSKRKGDYKSEVLATSLINELQSTYDINRYVLKKESGIWILDAPKCPAALIEFGYITNPDDFKFISNEKNQEKFASDILTAIQKFALVHAQGAIEHREQIQFETDKNTGKILATYNGIEVNQWDTIPKQISKIKAEDIKEITVNRGLIVIKLKNGDSILAIKSHDLEMERHQETQRLMELKQLNRQHEDRFHEIEAWHKKREHQADQENIMEIKNKEFKLKEEEFKKMLETNKDSPERKEEIRKLLETHQREFTIQQQEFKRMMEDARHQAEIEHEEFKRAMEMKNHEAEIELEEMRKMNQMKEREDQNNNKKQQQNKPKKKS